MPTHPVPGRVTITPDLTPELLTRIRDVLAAGGRHVDDGWSTVQTTMAAHCTAAGPDGTGHDLCTGWINLLRTCQQCICPCHDAGRIPFYDARAAVQRNTVITQANRFARRGYTWKLAGFERSNDAGTARYALLDEVKYTAAVVMPYGDGTWRAFVWSDGTPIAAGQASAEEACDAVNAWADRPDRPSPWFAVADADGRELTDGER